MKHIFVFGSKSIGQLTENFCKILDEYRKQGVRFLIGDCDGVDRAVQKYLAERSYQNVCIYASWNPKAENAGHVRNNVGCREVKFVTTEFLPGTYAYRREKDREMIACCSEAVCLWDCRSRGTGDNMRELADWGKTVYRETEGNRMVLGKSNYCRGVQCPKIVWMDDNKPKKAEKDQPENIPASGTRVAGLARRYFGDYVSVNFDSDKEKMVRQTEMLLREGHETIAGAAFFADGLFCTVDILRRTADGYDIVEVKSSTHVSDIYMEDMAFQYYVLNKAKIRVSHVYHMHINSHYVRQGELDLKGLFTIEDFTKQVKEKQESVEKNIRNIRKYAACKTEPEQDIGIYCGEPYPCAYFSHCGRHLPVQSVFDVRGLALQKKYEYYRNGIVSFEDMIREKPKLSEKQVMQVETAFFHRPDKIEKDRIADFLKTLTYPLYHLDFETYQQAIPQFDGVRPYAQIPFQYSLHIEKGDGSLEHREFLAKEGTDPRRMLAESLVRDIPPDACVLAYNMSFERRVIKDLAEQFADLAGHLLAVREHIHDLMVPFQKQYYYTEDMQGSYSIKYVLPALYPDDPDLDYHNLEGIHHGGEASAAFAELADHTPEEIQKIREHLLKYCGLDTFAMVKVLERLKDVCKG